jgi:hypothetical protein
VQKMFTEIRQLEAEDICANSLGVVVGLMFLVALERLIPPRWHRMIS